jgi:SAM-dependent methyltransferase
MVRWPHARRAEFCMALAPLPLSPGTILCDMPAGGGYLHRCLPAGVDYVAIEPAHHFFSQCPTVSGTRRFQAPLTSVPLEDSSVDYVVSLAGLHHAPDLEAIFAEMRRLVRPQGWVVIVEVEAGSASDTFLNGFVDAHNPMGHAGVFFDSATPDRLLRAGFQVVEDQSMAPSWTFADAGQMGAYCKSLFGIERASAGQVAECIEERFGCRAEPGMLSFGWPLRRLVCRPA